MTKIHELIAERDRLRRIVDAAEEALAVWDDVAAEMADDLGDLGPAFEKMRAILEEA